MMGYKHCCVVDAAHRYITPVLALLELDENGQEQENIQHYTLREGDSLIDAAPPVLRPYAGHSGLIDPVWDADLATWTEAATAEEIAAWEELHPAPAPPAPTELEMLREDNKLLSAKIMALGEQNDFQEELIVELAGVVYA